MRVYICTSRRIRCNLSKLENPRCRNLSKTRRNENHNRKFDMLKEVSSFRQPVWCPERPGFEKLRHFKTR